MNLNQKRSINVPQDFAFAAASDFPRFEREGAGGAKFTRIDEGSTFGVGSQWQVNTEFRGRPRRFVVKLNEFAPSERMVFETGSSKFTVLVSYAFASTGPESCELQMQIDTAARSLAGRLIFQTLQLARGRFERYLSEAMERMAAEMEAEYKPS